MFIDTLQAGLMSVSSQASLNTTFSVVLAALVHSSVVKREIKAQVIKITESINGVTDALKLELSTQSSRIGNIETGVIKLSNRVDAIEQKER